MTQDATDEFVMGGGGTSAKFETIGASVTGTVLSKRLTQQTDMKTKAPLFWDNGDPKNQVVVTLATEQRDPADPNDKGERVLYIKKGLQAAVREAIRAKGGTGIEIGSRLTVTHTGLGVAEQGLNAPKLYSAEYTPAADVAVTAGAPAPVAQPPAAQPPVQQPPAAVAPQAPAPVAPPAAAPAEVNPAAITTAVALINAGQDDTAVLASTAALGLVAEQVTGIRTALTLITAAQPDHVVLGAAPVLTAPIVASLRNQVGVPAPA